MDAARIIDELKAMAPVLAPWAALERAYATPPRAYHSLEHVLEVARLWHTETWPHPDQTFLAVLFHDAVYDVTRKDNEARSAELFESLCGPDVRVRQLIELTARHGRLVPADVDDEAARFLDCDMAILGSSPERFARYEQQIAAEYVPVVGLHGYSAGRRRFLESLLAKQRIFLSETFHARLDAAARANLRRALA